MTLPSTPSACALTAAIILAVFLYARYECRQAKREQQELDKTRRWVASLKGND